MFAAVDLGASGGRVMAGVVDGAHTELHAVHRFPNGARERDGHLRWNLTELYGQVLEGLTHLARTYPDVESVGIDTWAVDYGLLNADGHLLAEPIAYRDERTGKVIDDVHDRVSPEELYAINGLQFLPFNTIYQLAAEQRSDWWDEAAHIVLLPDLLAYWLTGNLRTEATNASTTGLVDISTGEWSTELLARLDVPIGRLATIVDPGEIRGVIHPDLCRALGLDRATVVTTVASHDTASAVAAVPATTRSFAYVASGTWSLVGVETETPVLSPESRAANFTNEGGVDGRVRFLRNAGGLWLLQESLRTWSETGEPPDLAALLGEAAALPSGGPTIDVDAPDLIAPGEMPDRIAAAISAQGRRPFPTRAALVRCIVDSLACAYAATVAQAQALTGHEVDVIHIVGGGSQNELLCQLTADTSGFPVIAGPVEATSLGSVLIQARTHGAAPTSLDAIRAGIAADWDLPRFEPRPSQEIS